MSLFLIIISQQFYGVKYGIYVGENTGFSIAEVVVKIPDN